MKVLLLILLLPFAFATIIPKTNYGVVVFGSINSSSNSSAETQLFHQDVCQIYKTTQKNKTPVLFLTDDFSCEGINVPTCGNLGCNFSSGEDLKKFISKHKLQNLDVMFIGHGTQNTDYGRPPEKNTIDLGPDNQYISTASLTSYIENALPLSFNKIRLFYYQCYGGGFHEITLNLLKDKKVKSACSLSQTSHKRIAIINTNEITISQQSQFAYAFTNMISSMKLTDVVVKASEIEKKNNYPTFPGNLAWQTSSMYLVDKFSATGYFYDETIKLPTLPKEYLHIPYTRTYPVEVLSFFPHGLQIVSQDEYLNQFLLPLKIITNSSQVALIKKTLACETL